MKQLYNLDTNEIYDKLNTSSKLQNSRRKVEIVKEQAIGI